MTLLPIPNLPDSRLQSEKLKVRREVVCEYSRILVHLVLFRGRISICHRSPLTKKHHSDDHQIEKFTFG